ncbi:hypothetical protein ACFCV8_23860 [Streptomyces sp. NPDC056347]|uniref:hypothetical protein n=1 Tax=Streptomyces sp. NPDC056347 TaxID=3345790 RepID=UPI0035E20F4E
MRTPVDLAAQQGRGHERPVAGLDVAARVQGRLCAPVADVRNAQFTVDDRRCCT